MPRGKRVQGSFESWLLTYFGTLFQAALESSGGSQVESRVARVLSSVVT